MGGGGTAGFVSWDGFAPLAGGGETYGGGGATAGGGGICGSTAAPPAAPAPPLLPAYGFTRLLGAVFSCRWYTDLKSDPGAMGTENPTAMSNTGLHK